MSDYCCAFWRNNPLTAQEGESCRSCYRPLPRLAAAKLNALGVIDKLMGETGMTLPELCDHLAYVGREYPGLKLNGHHYQHPLPTAIADLTGRINDLLKPAGGLAAVPPTSRLGKTLTWTKIALCKAPSEAEIKGLEHVE